MEEKIYPTRKEAVLQINDILNKLEEKVKSECEKVISYSGLKATILSRRYCSEWFDVKGKGINKLKIGVGFRLVIFEDFNKLEKEKVNIRMSIRTLRKKIQEIMHKHGLKYSQKYGYRFEVEAYYKY